MFQPATIEASLSSECYSSLLGNGPVNIPPQRNIALSNKASTARQPSGKQVSSTIQTVYSVGSVQLVDVKFVRNYSISLKLRSGQFTTVGDFIVTGECYIYLRVIVTANLKV
jgi:hypothetical protein